MARPLPRRRSEAPDADTYAPSSRRRGAEPEDEPTEERRPRRERGELPAAAAGRRRGAADEPEEEPTSSRRRRGSEPEEDAGWTGPKVEELDSLTDKEWDDLLDTLDIPQGLSESAEFEAVKEAIEERSAPPARSSRRGRDSEPEEETSARSSRRGGRRAEPEDEEPPARGRGRRSASADEEDDSAPRRKPRGGFDGFKTTRSKTFTGDFKLTPEELLSKFLEDEPFDSYAEHALYQELKDGQRIWNCIEDDCPLCGVGHKPRAVSLWNIVAIPESGEPRVEVLKAGPMLTKALESKAALKTGPLSKEYYGLAQPEQKKNEGVIPPIVEVYRERDVKTEWNIDPFTDAELDEFLKDCPDPEGYVIFPSKAQLKAIARKLMDD